MKVALYSRLKRLEDRLNRHANFIWHRVLVKEGETKADAIERYIASGNVVGENDRFIFRIGLPSEKP